ncbi:unnamed protein product, partial [Rotaria socialis]
GFRSPQRWNFRLMLICSFRYGVLAQDRDGVLDCFQLKNSEVVSIMEIRAVILFRNVEHFGTSSVDSRNRSNINTV